MYYLSRTAPIKVTASERFHLYNHGDECVDITGGWVITGWDIIKNTNNIQLNHAGDSGRVIKTVNNINLSAVDRIFVVIKTTGNATNYGLSFGTVTSGTTVSRLSWINANGNITLNLSQSNFAPNIEKTLQFLSTTSNLPIGFINGFGTWYISEIYIEKYN